MEIRIRFENGPMHGQTALTDRLDDIKVFFPTNDRRVFVYQRTEEATVYDFNRDISDNMTERYDESKAWFSSLGDAPSLRFEPERGSQ
jgi:hypothetical protein